MRFEYVIYLSSTPELVWRCLTEPDLTDKYWKHHNVSDWRPGSRWEHRPSTGGAPEIVGRVLESRSEEFLSFTFESAMRFPAIDAPIVSIRLESEKSVVRLTLRHENLADETSMYSVATAWPAVLSNLKTFLETGDVIPQSLWELIS